MTTAALALTLLSLVNAQRAIRHIHPVRPRARIAVCGERAKVRPLPCIHRHGMPRASVVGVIEAWGYRTPVQAVKAWLNWPRHRAIMLDPQYSVGGAWQRGRFYRVVFAR